MPSSHRVPPFPSWNSLVTLLSSVLQSDIWELIVGYGEKGNILRSKLERSLLWNSISMCECSSQSYTFLFSVYLLTQFSGNLQWDTSERTEAYGDKRNILRWKLERSFVRNFLVLCEFISQGYTYVSWSIPLTLSLRNVRRASLDRMEAYADKGNIISSKHERSFLRNFFLLCEFISPCYTLDLRKKCANTLFLESAKWYLGAFRGPWWERKYRQMKTRKKLSLKLLGNVWIHLTELHLCFMQHSTITVFEEPEKEFFGSYWGLRW